MIQTERLTVRRVTAADWPAIRDIWIDQQRSDMGQYDRPNMTDDSSVRSRIAKWDQHRGSSEHMFFAVCMAERMIGYISLNRTGDDYEVGYCFHSDYHGWGYARESLIAVLAHAESSYSPASFTAGTAMNNLPSVRLLTRAGFRLIGQERVSFYQDENGEPIWFDGGIFRRDAGQPYSDN